MHPPSLSEEMQEFLRDQVQLIVEYLDHEPNPDVRFLLLHAQTLVSILGEYPCTPHDVVCA